MPRLRIIYDIDGWAYHNEALALQKYAPSDFEVSLAALPTEEDAESAVGAEPADVVFLLRSSKVRLIRKVLTGRGWPTKLVASWNEGPREPLAVFHGLYEAADFWIINNRIYWEAVGRPPGAVAIANGVDCEVFQIQRPPSLREPKVLWTGSENHRETKGYDDMMAPLRERLHAVGIPCELLLVDSFGDGKRTRAEMARWYNQGTVLVCASRTEGTPNPALEAAACGCTLVSTRVGNMLELIRDGVNGYLVERSVDALFRGVERACENYVRLSEAMQRDIRPWHWAERSQQFFDVFRSVLSSDAAGLRG